MKHRRAVGPYRRIHANEALSHPDASLPVEGLVCSELFRHVFGVGSRYGRGLAAHLRHDAPVSAGGLRVACRAQRGGQQLDASHEHDLPQRGAATQNQKSGPGADAAFLGAGRGVVSAG